MGLTFCNSMNEEPRGVIDLSQSSGRMGWGPRTLLCQLNIAKSVSPTEFDLMRKRGFLRMGETLMCHDNLNSYSSQFQFRVDVTKFKLNKRQRKLMRRWQDYLDGNPNKEDSDKKPKLTQTVKAPSTTSMSEEPLWGVDFETKFLASLKTLASKLKSEGFVESKALDKVKVFADKVDPNRCLLTNLVQILFQENKKEGDTIESFVQKLLESKSLAALRHEFSTYVLAVDKKGFLKLSQPSTVVAEEPKSTPAQAQAQKDAKTAIKGQKPDKKPIDGQKQHTADQKLKKSPNEDKPQTKQSPAQSKHKFEIKMEEPGFRADKQAVVNAYQRGGLGFGIPGGVRGAGSFKGVANVTKYNGEHTLELGSKHMCFYLDDKLVGLGVVDLADTMLCSLFFVYDPVLKPFSFGILSVLFEIQYVADKQKHFPEFRYQNLGAYELENQKMEYKMNFRPAELLCPYSMKFVDFDERVQKCLESHDNKLCGPSVTQRDQNEEFLSVAEVKPFLKAHVSVEIQGKLQKFSELPETVVDRVATHYEGVFVGLGKTLTRKLGFRVGGPATRSHDSEDEDD